MTEYLPGILALLIAAAGWFYLFYSRAASKLAPVEGADINRRRVRLRRVGGVMMVLIAAAFYLGWVEFRAEQLETAAIYWLVVMLLMGINIVLGLIDLRLTHKLRQSQRRQGPL